MVSIQVNDNLTVGESTFVTVRPGEAGGGAGGAGGVAPRDRAAGGQPSLGGEGGVGGADRDSVGGGAAGGFGLDGGGGAVEFVVRGRLILSEDTRFSARGGDGGDANEARVSGLVRGGGQSGTAGGAGGAVKLQASVVATPDSGLEPLVNVCGGSGGFDIDFPFGPDDEGQSGRFVLGDNVATGAPAFNVLGRSETIGGVTDVDPISSVGRARPSSPTLRAARSCSVC